MTWLERLRAQAGAAPTTKLDHFLQRQRSITLRLPRWLVGTPLVVALTFGVWSAVGRRGLWGPVRWLCDGDPVYTVLLTVMLPMIPTMIALWVLARILRPDDPSAVPTARVNR